MTRTLKILGKTLKVVGLLAGFSAGTVLFQVMTGKPVNLADAFFVTADTVAIGGLLLAFILGPAKFRRILRNL
jgi:hypothetical protein